MRNSTIKFLPFFLLCWLGTGCSSVRVSRQAPAFYPMAADGSPDLKKINYEQQQVSEVGTKWAKVGGKAYTLPALRDYFDKAGAHTAAEKLDQANSRRKWANAAWYLCPISGLILGYGVAEARIAVGSRQPISPVYEEFGPGEAWLGLLMGFAAAPLYYFAFHTTAQGSREEAGKLFNGWLAERLKLDLQGVPGGAKAGAEIKF